MNRQFKDELTDTWFKLGIAFGIILLVAMISFYIWGEKIAFGDVKCAFYTVVHLYCPGCGGTRAAYYLFHGRIIKSFLFNPFVPYTVFDYLFFMINTVLVKKTKKMGFKGFPVTITVYVGVAILLLQWIIRNILLVGLGITCL